jgi:Spy/CpxP family protein refolding chaperone
MRDELAFSEFWPAAVKMAVGTMGDLLRLRASLDWTVACWRVHVVDIAGGTRPNSSFAVRKEPVNQKKFLVITLMLVAFASANSALAQNSPSQKKDAVKPSVTNDGAERSPDDFMQLLRKDVRSQKKQIIAENMDLTDTEAQKFWPVYDQYAGELSKIYDTKIALLNDYADNRSTMTGEQAETYIRKRAEVEQSVMQLRVRYIPAFRKVLSGRETALFYQLDWRLGLAIEVELLQVPLINQ